MNVTFMLYDNLLENGVEVFKVISSVTLISADDGSNTWLEVFQIIHRKNCKIIYDEYIRQKYVIRSCDKLISKIAISCCYLRGHLSVTTAGREILYEVQVPCVEA